MSDLKRVRVVFFTEKTKIEGIITVEEGFRVSDYLNKEKFDFVPLTDVRVTNLEGKVILEKDFVCVNKKNIIISESEGI